VADKDEILAYYEMMLDRLRPKLATAEVDSQGWTRLSRNAQKLLHDCSELEGLLQARQRVELEVTVGNFHL
jgi:hypothetical protein